MKIEWIHALGPLPRYLFKRFDEEEHARGFAAGHVRVTTLGICRSIEDETRRDSAEGQSVYESGLIEGRPDDPHVQARLGMFPIRVTGGGHVTVSDCRTEDEMDAFVLCASTDAEQTSFGPWCVRIRDPLRVFTEITRELGSIVQLRGRTLRLVTYGSRTASAERPQDRIFPALVKPPKYSKEREFRMVWIASDRGHVYERVDLECRAFKALCSRLW